MSTQHHTDPSRFLAAPRRSEATPNPAGTYAFFSLSSYSFESHRGEAGVYVLDLGSGTSNLLSRDTQSSGHTWTGVGSEFLWKKQFNGSTEIWLDDAATPGQTAYQAGRINALITLISIIRLAYDSFAIIALGPKSTAAQPQTYSTGKEFSSLPVRSFFVEPPKQQVLWYLKFSAYQLQPSVRFKLSWQTIDVLKDTKLEFQPYTGVVPMGPMNGGASRFGFVFAGTTQDQSKYQDRVWTSDLFFIPISQLESSENHKPILPQKIEVETFTGAVSLPIISDDGIVAFLKNEDKTKVTCKNHIFIVDLTTDTQAREIVLHSGSEPSPWPLNPESITWSNDKTKLFTSAADTGRQRTYQITIPSNDSTNKNNIPQPIDVGNGSVTSAFRFSTSPSDNRLLISRSGFVDSSSFLVVDPSTDSPRPLSILQDCENLGLKREQVSEFWFKGAGNYQVHSWIAKPSYFEEGEKYPLALMIHGGPHSSWQDLWGVRWNPLLFAEQGYIVVSPDVTGSIGYNEEFKEAAILELAGRPYQDLEKCFEHVEANIPYADTTNAVALGGSYGGYLVYWLAGQPFARKFKALVAHAGMFSAQALYASDVPDIWKVLFGGYESDPSQIVKVFEKWDPAQFSHLWETPILITHGEVDRRCPTSMGLSAFTAAQMKGVECKLVTYTDEGHFISKPENALHWHRVVIEWINKYTGKN